MILDTTSFLNILLGNREVQRYCRILSPELSNKFFILRSSGVPRRILEPIASDLLSSFVGHEDVLARIIGETILISKSESRVRNFFLDLSEPIDDPETLFPEGMNTILYRDGEKLYVTNWR